MARKSASGTTSTNSGPSAASTSTMASAPKPLPPLLCLTANTTQREISSHKTRGSQMGRHICEYSEDEKLNMGAQVLFAMVPDPPGEATRSLTISEAEQLLKTEVRQDEQGRYLAKGWVSTFIERAKALDRELGPDTVFVHGRDIPFGELWSSWANSGDCIDKMQEWRAEGLLGSYAW